MVTKRYSKVCDMSTSVPGMQDILYDFGLVVGIPGHVVTLVQRAVSDTMEVIAPLMG